MFAVIIKNSILVFLIILIFHLIIKNHLIDLEIKNSNSVVLNNYNVNNEKVFKNQTQNIDKKIKKIIKNDLIENNNDLIKKVEVSEKILEDSITPQNVSMNFDLEELYNFVYDDEANNELNEIYKNSSLKEIEDTIKDNINCDVKCPEKNTETKKEFCMSKVEEHHAINNKPILNNLTEPKGILGTETKSTNDGYQILFEYDKMNNNNVMDGLMGFETFESTYSLL